jgi:hypothetical protein
VQGGGDQSLADYWHIHVGCGPQVMVIGILETCAYFYISSRVHVTHVMVQAWGL